VKYRYKLEGADAEWSAPTAQRSVNYARLAPGSYRFWVKAINRSGRESPDPAMLEFRILPPVWQRWWFMTLAALFSATAIYSIYRVRISRLIELERVRTRIASDLHDDIGSNLSKIAILSEVAHQQAGGADSTIRQPLSTIARISRESVASMSDVVWAINPGKDSLRDLTRRMRAFASDTFTARNIAFEFHASSAVDLKLGADVRRNVYLIFKETVNNTVRHSKCSKAVIELRIDGTWLELKVDDNGKGFDPSALDDGNGLLNMKKRAALVGGKLAVASNPASGTQIYLRVPINRGKFASTLKSLRRS
jgi:signal transduction histidine kinase